ncbi:MAG: hypothetical protein FJ267_00835, partial [Planctomycetes bacterium]|nr:hypothetical protein [Planctomycetota bacterium]
MRTTIGMILAIGLTTHMKTVDAQENQLNPDIQISRVYGPEVPGGKYKHPASITQLANGDLYLMFYGGSGEYSTDTAVYGSRLKAGQAKWTEPVVIADTPFVSEGNPVVWQAPDGLVWVFYVVRYGETWSTSRIQAKISKDGAVTWSDSTVLAFEEGMMVRGQPIVLKSGDYLLPIYHETGFDTEVVGAESTSLFLRYSSRGQTWSTTGRIRSKNGNIQPAVVALSDDHLLAFCRRGGGYGPESRGFIVRSESFDAGRTWTEGKDSAFPNPNAAVDLIRLRNGHLALAYNHSMSTRDPLAVMISTDDGKTFPHRINIAEGGTRDFAYPYLIQTKDDKLHLIFTSDKRSVINHAVIDESQVVNSPPLFANSANAQAVESVKSKKLTVANAAWWGFQEEDSTDALQSAIDSGAKKVYVPNMGKDWIVRPITLASNQELVFEEGVTVAAKRGEFRAAGDSVFRANKASNLIIRGYGATIRMQKEDYMIGRVLKEQFNWNRWFGQYERGEWRCAFHLSGCQNLSISGLTLSDTGGDGILLSGNKESVCKNVTFRDLICDNNYRQGLSIISVDGLTVENCLFKNTWGTPPSSGVDIEPDSPDQMVKGVVFRKCRFVDNYGDGIEVFLSNLRRESGDVSILFEDCFVSTKRGTGIRVTKVRDDGPKGLIEFRNCVVDGTEGYGVRLRDKSAEGAKV